MVRSFLVFVRTWSYTLRRRMLPQIAKTVYLACIQIQGDFEDG
jgi:hypothetical protein